MKKTVGRPKKENALSDAERQKKRRERKKIEDNEKIENEYIKISTYRKEMEKAIKSWEERYKNAKNEENKKTNFDGLNALKAFDLFFNNGKNEKKQKEAL